MSFPYVAASSSASPAPATSEASSVIFSPIKSPEAFAKFLLSRANSIVSIFCIKCGILRVLNKNIAAVKTPNIVTRPSPPTPPIICFFLDLLADFELVLPFTFSSLKPLPICLSSLDFSAASALDLPVGVLSSGFSAPSVSLGVSSSALSAAMSLPDLSADGLL